MDEDRGHELHRFLGAIFAQELSFSEKEKNLVKEFGIKLEGDRKERLTNMCNLGEGIWEQGIEQGKISGIIETCMKLNMSENDIIEKIKEIMHISGEEAKSTINRLCKKIEYKHRQNYFVRSFQISRSSFFVK